MSNREIRKTLIFAICFTIIGLLALFYSKPTDQKYGLIFLAIAAIDWGRLLYNAHKFNKFKKK